MLQKELEGLREENQRLKISIEQTEEQVQRDVKDMDQKLKELREENQRLKKSIEQTEEQVQRDVQDMDQKLKELREENQRLEKSNKESVICEQNLLRDVQEKGEQLNVLVERNKKLMLSNQNNKERQNQLEREVQEKGEQLNGLVQEKDQLLMTLQEDKYNLEKQILQAQQETNVKEIARSTLAKEIEDIMQKKVSDDSNNILSNSPLQKMVKAIRFLWIRSILAPKGDITGDELGTFMGALVAVTSFVVSYSNKDGRKMFLSACVSLLGVLCGKVFNNLLTYISMDKDATIGSILR
ncbi:unnamed protein product [Arabis nemorensis]|uniref:Uncharacterized protein n=1 Tax=Arabis nemorensis TaxID=586526 RepID=A0A565BDC9_9BRAS|nr:unnamed protein product [Arabis nemorensis]